jgi:hypothetical protein
MRASWEITTIVLRIWVAGALLFLVVALSDFVFRRPHSARVLLTRIIVGLLWPLALFSSRGRSTLFGKFTGVQS